MDQHSFEQGVLAGLRTAVVCVQQTGGHTYDHVRAIRAQIAELKDLLECRRTGKREMVWDDIFLRMPMMTAADLFGPERPSLKAKDSGHDG